MYNGDEFVEFTNVGDAGVDFARAGLELRRQQPHGGLVLALRLRRRRAGQSVIMSEVAAATFRTNWGLALSVSVLGGNVAQSRARGRDQPLRRADQLVDRLTYDDQTIGGPRTLDLSANIAFANLGTNQANLAQASFVGDSYGSYLSSTTPARPGNPGTYRCRSPAPPRCSASGCSGSRCARRARRAARARAVAARGRRAGARARRVRARSR